VGTLVALALGSNVGDRQAHLDAAVAAIRVLPCTRIIALSRWIETDPIGPGIQGRYLNGAALIRTSLSPQSLLAELHRIEQSRGRLRSQSERWGPRTLDIDILTYGDLVLNEPNLTLPHPRLHERLFVLDPLSEIAPDLVIPGLSRERSKTVRELRGLLRG
jgi:2-amino-4-hydroxy-6-hydroxymethyldihydropteridine diphosphokinase